MKTNKIGTLFLVSILAIAGLGITYAGWTDVITVTGTVQTGTVEFEVTEYSGTWVWKYSPEHLREIHYDIPTDTNEDPNGYYDDTDYTLVAHSYAYDDDTTEADVDFKFINLYPCVDFEVDFKFTIGSIPVHLTGTGLTWSGQTIDGIDKEWINGIDNLPSPTISEEIYLDDTLIWDSSITDIVQLHPEEEYHYILTIHIPQHNAYMNAYAEGSCSFDIIQWSDSCDTTTEDKLLDIPRGPHFAALGIEDWFPGDEGYGSDTNPPITPYTAFDIELMNINPETDDLYNGIWPAFCADSLVDIYVNDIYDIMLYDSRDPELSIDAPFATDDEEWDKVNYLLNNYENVVTDPNWRTLQAAIWYFTDDTLGGNFEDFRDWDIDDYNAIVADTEANGEGFNPQEGQWLAVVCLVTDDMIFDEEVQITFLVVDP